MCFLSAVLFVTLTGVWVRRLLSLCISRAIAVSRTWSTRTSRPHSVWDSDTIMISNKEFQGKRCDRETRGKRGQVRGRDQARSSKCERRRERHWNGCKDGERSKFSIRLPHVSSCLHQVAEIETYLLRLAHEIEPGVQGVAVGSFRRGKPTCGDCDIIFKVCHSLYASQHD